MRLQLLIGVPPLCGCQLGHDRSALRQRAWRGPDLLHANSRLPNGGRLMTCSRSFSTYSARTYGAAGVRMPKCKACYFLSRFHTLTVRPLPSSAVKSVGRSIPGAVVQNFSLSPSSS